MLAYAPGAVLFVGLDAEGRPRAATARSIESAVDRPFWERDTAAGQRHKKHNIAGSKMHNAAVLRGDDPSTVWIVEGATDALSIHDLHRLAGKPTPTVIVSGGAGQKAFIAQPGPARSIIDQAHKIKILLDRELGDDGKPDQKKQALTNALHEAQAEKIREIGTAADVAFVATPTGQKDVNALLQTLRRASPADAQALPLREIGTAADMPDFSATPHADAEKERQRQKPKRDREKEISGPGMG